MRVLASGMTSVMSHERPATAASDSRIAVTSASREVMLACCRPGVTVPAGKACDWTASSVCDCSPARAATTRSADTSHATRGRELWFDAIRYVLLPIHHLGGDW